MSSARRRLRVPRHVLVAVAVALAVRVAGALVSRSLVGDEVWYAEMGRTIAGPGHAFDGPGAFVRPPVTGLWMGAVFALFGGGSLVAVRLANAVLGAATPWLAWRIGRGAFPRHRVAAGAACAWVQAVNPLAVRDVGNLWSENLAGPVVLCVVLAGLALARRPTWRRAAVLAACSALLMHVRVDAGVVVAGVVGLGFLRSLLRRGRRRGGRRAAALRWAAAGAMAIALCLPWSAFASRHVGRPTFVATLSAGTWFDARAGWLAWISHVDAPRRDWVGASFSGPDAVGTEWIPETSYASADERTRVRELVARDHAAGELLADVDAEFARIARERRRAEPFRFHVVLPTRRLLDIWFHPLDDDPSLGSRPTPDAPKRWALELVLRVFRPLAGVGFLLAAAALLRPRVPAAIVGAAVVARSVGMIYGIPLAAGIACYESRYQSIVQPLALLLVAGAVVSWTRRRRRRAPGAG